MVRIIVNTVVIGRDVLLAEAESCWASFVMTGFDPLLV